MSLSDFFQVNDVGIPIVIVATTSDGITPVNLVAATNLTVYLYRPDTVLISGTGILVSDGSDGKFQYSTQINDLAVPGQYKTQGSYEIAGNLKHTEKSVFLVETNLMGVN